MIPTDLFHQKWRRTRLNRNGGVRVSGICKNATIYYNTWLLSELLAFHREQNNIAEVELIKKVSPIAWQHIHIHGRYQFRIGKVILDVRKMVSKVKL